MTHTTNASVPADLPAQAERAAMLKWLSDLTEMQNRHAAEREAALARIDAVREGPLKAAMLAAEAALDEACAPLRVARDAQEEQQQEEMTNLCLSRPDGDWLTHDWTDTSVARCALTGVPLLSTDEVLEDPDTGEVVLRAAAGLPPRDVDDDDADHEGDTTAEVA